MNESTFNSLNCCNGTYGFQNEFFVLNICKGSPKNLNIDARLLDINDCGFCNGPFVSM